MVVVVVVAGREEEWGDPSDREENNYSVIAE